MGVCVVFVDMLVMFCVVSFNSEGSGNFVDNRDSEGRNIPESRD